MFLASVNKKIFCVEKIEKLKGNNKIVEKYLYKYCLSKEQNIDKIGEV